MSGECGGSVDGGDVGGVDGERLLREPKPKAVWMRLWWSESMTAAVIGDDGGLMAISLDDGGVARRSKSYIFLLCVSELVPDYFFFFCGK